MKDLESSMKGVGSVVVVVVGGDGGVLEVRSAGLS